MRKIKELRTLMGMTQKDLARPLRTTQQTVARWESGQTEVPTSALKDMAVLFGCSVDDILGVKLKLREWKRSKLAHAKHDTPFGTLRAVLDTEVRDYPIDESERDRLVDEIIDHDVIDDQEWIKFQSLDNRLVFIHPSVVKTLDFVCDDEEAMPFFVSPEVYRSVSSFTPHDDYSPVLAKQRRELLREIVPNTSDEQTALTEAREKLTSLNIFFKDGTTSSLHFPEIAAKSLSILYDNETIGNDILFVIDREGVNRRFVNLDKIAVIEAPLETYLQLLGRQGRADADDADED